jgi:signal peptidase I
VKTEPDRSAVASPEPDEGSGAKRRNPILRFLGEMPGLIIMSLILAILIKTFLIQAFYIPSQSMEDTLQINDRVLVSKVPYYFHDPQRGDVIVFSEPDPAKQPQRSFIGGIAHWIFEGIGVQKPDNPDFIKRVIGLPGDTVYAKNNKVYVNGVPIHEPYVKGTTTDFPTGFDKVTVPPDMYFVLGDNREASQDSRFGLGVIADPKTMPGIGFVPRDDIIGKAWVIVWPKDHWGTL